MVDPGYPVGMSKTVSADGVAEHGGSNPLYTIIYTESMEQAVALAKACPIIGNSTVEVAEIHEVLM
jgi:hypothetical protein